MLMYVNTDRQQGLALTYGLIVITAIIFLVVAYSVIRTRLRLRRDRGRSWWT